MGSERHIGKFAKLRDLSGYSAIYNLDLMVCIDLNKGAVTFVGGLYKEFDDESMKAVFMYLDNK